MQRPAAERYVCNRTDRCRTLRYAFTGSYRTVTQASLDGLGVGDSVRIERGGVLRY